MKGFIVHKTQNANQSLVLIIPHGTDF